MLNQRLYHLFLITTLSIAARAETSQDITDLFEYRFVELWEHGDAAGIASLWVSDGDWSNVIGSRRIQRGRAAVESVWTIGLQGRDRPEDRAIHVLSRQHPATREVACSRRRDDGICSRWREPDSRGVRLRRPSRGRSIADRFGTHGTLTWRLGDPRQFICLTRRQSLRTVAKIISHSWMDATCSSTSAGKRIF